MLLSLYVVSVYIEDGDLERVRVRGKRDIINGRRFWTLPRMRTKILTWYQNL